jgi:hypothetical protein
MQQHISQSINLGTEMISIFYKKRGIHFLVQNALCRLSALSLRALSKASSMIQVSISQLSGMGDRRNGDFIKRGEIT